MRSMSHGAQHYFQETHDSRRRIALGTLALHALALALVLATQIPLVRHALERAPRRIVRFGYEGPDRIVEKTLLPSPGGYREPLQDVGRVLARPARAGGGGTQPSAEARAPSPNRRSNLPTEGEDEYSLIARARARNAAAPLLQSSELVIESMIEPRYPERLYEKGIEGRVALMALVDTAGFVADITVVGGTGQPEFEESAVDAVKHAKFRPYRQDGATQEVYALIRYRFRIY